MKKFHRVIALTLVFAIGAPSIYAQEEEIEENAYSEAYVEGSQSAHWSVYIPIALLTAGAIYFGIADRTHSSENSSDPYNALGSIANSKRVGRSLEKKSGSQQSKQRYRSGYNHG